MSTATRATTAQHQCCRPLVQQAQQHRNTMLRATVQHKCNSNSGLGETPPKGGFHPHVAPTLRLTVLRFFPGKEASPWTSR